MPYETTADLPPSIRHLPPCDREIFLSAFNNAWRSYADRGPDAQEEIAFRVAWSAVKKQFRKHGEAWVPRQRGS